MTILPVGNKKERKEGGRQPSGGHLRSSGSSTNTSSYYGRQPQSSSGIAPPYAPPKRARLDVVGAAAKASKSASKHQMKSVKTADSSASSPDVHRNSDDESASARRVVVLPSSTPVGSNVAGSSRMAIAEMTIEQIEVEFEQRMLALGYTIKTMKGDGACMFRAVADQMYGDEEMHEQIRKLCLDYIVSNRDHFSDFITEDFDAYVLRKRNPVVHGNNVEMQAIAEMFNRPVFVYEYSDQPLNTFQPTSGTDNPPLRLSYHGASHYNSIVDPNAATIGVGLGLPDFKPGEADRSQVQEATKASETTAIEETMLADKLAATDHEATDRAMQQQVERESYCEWLATQNKAKGKRKSPSPPTQGSSFSFKQTPVERLVNGADMTALTTSSDTTPTTVTTTTTSTAITSNATVSTSNMAADDDLLAHVLALSQQEFVDARKGEEEKPSTSGGGQS